MGAEDALDAYDVAQKETKDAAVTNKKEESTTAIVEPDDAFETLR